MLFENLSLIDPLLRALSKEGYESPTPIQQKAIPVVLEKKDLLGCAQTGTGKTAAFVLPILQLLQEEKASGGIRALVLTPTRELAIQIGESIEAYGRYLSLRHRVIFGGVSQHGQVQDIRKGVDILVATPGRLLDLISQKLLTLDRVKFFVLDEADRMLDMGFVHDVKKIIALLPVHRQTLLFSATMPAEISQLAQRMLKNPVRVEVTPVSSTVERIRQQIYFTDKGGKRQLLEHLLREEDIETVLVFTQMKHAADKLARKLSQSGIHADAIHGNKSQQARQRALENFRNRKIRVLVATDIAARGIDIDDLTHVINYDLPNVPETYVHRIGRTGRAGAEGTAISFCDQEERTLLKDIQSLIRMEIPVQHDHPFKPGEYVQEQIARPASLQQAARPSGRGRVPAGRRRNQAARRHS